MNVFNKKKCLKIHHGLSNNTTEWRRIELAKTVNCTQHGEKEKACMAEFGDKWQSHSVLMSIYLDIIAVTVRLLYYGCWRCRGKTLLTIAR